jgi:DNA repair protein RadC
MIQDAGSLSAAITKASGLPSEKTVRLVASLELARRVLKEKITNGSALNSPASVREYLRLKLQALPHEVFVALFLDAQNRVIEIEELFRGTLTQTSVYPREVVKRALHFNCGAVIFAHNHPSGIAEPSHADETLTQALKQALALIDVRVLDHFIVAGSGVLSFAERGLL